MKSSSSLSKLSGAAWLLIIGTIALAVVTVYFGAKPNPNKLAGSILQGCTLVVGLAGSFIAGRDASREAATELVRPHARSAFRRVQNLYAALGRQRDSIAVEQRALEEAAHAETGSVPLVQVMASFRALHLMVTEQISTADDALEDWRDLVPDEVMAIEAEGKKREQGTAIEAEDKKREPVMIVEAKDKKREQETDG